MYETFSLSLFRIGGGGGANPYNIEVKITSLIEML